MGNYNVMNDAYKFGIDLIDFFLWIVVAICFIGIALVLVKFYMVTRGVL